MINFDIIWFQDHSVDESCTNFNDEKQLCVFKTVKVKDSSATATYKQDEFGNDNSIVFCRSYNSFGLKQYRFVNINFVMTQWLIFSSFLSNSPIVWVKSPTLYK